jgi:hypothetical protein
MDGESLENQTQATDATASTENQGTATKTYTQEEFDQHMAGMRKAIEQKFEKRFNELGDLDELKQLKANAEKQKQEEAMKRGEFEKVLQDLAAKKDAEIQQRDSIIKEYKVNSPLLDAAARYKAVAPEQVKSLLQSNVRLGEAGDVEVVGTDGTVRYNDSGSPYSVDDLVKEFLTTNPHFVSSGPSTTNTRSNDGATIGTGEFDFSKLDMKNPADRQKYKQAREAGLL